MLLDLYLSKKNRNNKKRNSKNSLSISVLKALSWRLEGTFDTIIIAYFITEKPWKPYQLELKNWEQKFTLFFLLTNLVTISVGYEIN
tara:strand:+ start:208 stop:468 length:261 start_codon:yes stop_codon:yes gene_type:complete